MIKERLMDLRKLMAEYCVDAYLVPSSDPHQSEYLPDHYKTREFISGFTGSSGMAVIFREEAGLWTDGRYHQQAERELEGTGFQLFPSGNPGIPSYLEYLKKKVPADGRIGLDGNCFGYQAYMQLIRELSPRIVVTDLDLIGSLWPDRPSLPYEAAFIHDIDYAGQSVKEKMAKLLDLMKARETDWIFISRPEDIAYLYNIRGKDMDFCPVVLAYSLITYNQAYLFINQNKINHQVKSHLMENGIEIKDYELAEEFLKAIPSDKTLYYDPAQTTVRMVDSFHHLPHTIQGINLTNFLRSEKNPIEIKNQRQAYLKEGIALLHFLYWLERSLPDNDITEIDAANKLLEFRTEQGLFLTPSFQTISAYGKNAAMPHYVPNDENSASMKNEGLYLIDCGAHYLDGTTDITRTIALGPCTELEREHYTLVLKAHIALMSAVFRKGTLGSSLDAIARLPLWKKGLDYQHGTGHGIGYVTSVHESPEKLAFNHCPALELDRIISIEPGLYIPGSHGIRIENAVLVVKDQTTKFGEFYAFDCLSFCPIDTKPLKLDMLTSEEIGWLNGYHKTCYQMLSPYVTGEVSQYLIEITEEIHERCWE